MLTASLPIVSIYRTWSTNRILRFLQLSREDVVQTWNWVRRQQLVRRKSGGRRCQTHLALAVGTGGRPWG